MNKYLNNDCISIVNEYSRDFTHQELMEILYEEIANDLVYSIDKQEKKWTVTYELYEIKTDITYENCFSLENSTDFIIHLFANWNYVRTKTSNIKDHFEKIHKIIYEMALNKKDFVQIKNTIKIYNYIENIFNKYYCLNNNEKNIISKNVF